MITIFRPLLVRQLVGAALALAIRTDLMALTVDEFQELTDNRIEVRRSLGVREAHPLSAEQIEVTLGMSVGPAVSRPHAYRIMSPDDATYAFERFVMPTSVAIRVEDELPAVKGAPFEKFQRTVVTLTLPAPLSRGCHYHVIAQGEGGQMVTAAHTAASFSFAGGATGSATTLVDRAALTIRQLEPVGPRLVRIELGPDANANACADSANFSARIAGTPVVVTHVGRRTTIDTFLPVGWPFAIIPMHDVFLELERPFSDGERIEVEVSAAVIPGGGRISRQFRVDRTVSRSIKCNQVGYPTHAPLKIAYLGRWMGSFPESTTATHEPSAGTSSDPVAGPSLSFTQPPAFELCDERTDAVAFTGKARLVHRSGTMDEGHYHVDHSGENVYDLDFSPFVIPGRYYLRIAGVGRSAPFAIGDDVYARAFALQAYGVFAQRCGIALAPPYSQWRRIACHANGVVPTLVSRMDPYDLKQLPKAIEPVKAGEKSNSIAIHGGHHDAGDYNPRSHLDVAQVLLDAYEMRPGNFTDGQLAIPEAGNGIPDILDEAAWALRLWQGLQDADGGVRNGTESNGDPDFITTCELDTLGDFAFAKDAAGSYEFAGAMAQSAIIWKKLGRIDEAQDMLRHARAAYAWADAHPPAKLGDGAERAAKLTDPKAYAAAQLLRACGEAQYQRDFLASCVWTSNPQAPLTVYKRYDQERAAWAYVKCAAESVDGKVQASIRAALIAWADALIGNAQTMAYAFIRDPYSPITWGTGAYEHSVQAVMRAHSLTGDARYLAWIIRTCDNTLGANPLGLSFIVGLGSRTVRAPLHNSRYSQFGEVVDGMQVEGPVQNGVNNSIRASFYPAIREDFANLHTFVDAHFAIGMDEGLVRAQAETMATFGYLLPPAPTIAP